MLGQFDLIAVLTYRNSQRLIFAKIAFSTRNSSKMSCFPEDSGVSKCLQNSARKLSGNYPRSENITYAIFCSGNSFFSVLRENPVMQYGKIWWGGIIFSGKRL